MNLSVQTSFYIAVAVFLASIVGIIVTVVFNEKRRRLSPLSPSKLSLKPYHYFVFGIFAASLILHLPVVSGGLLADSGNVVLSLNSLLVSAQMTVKLFTVDADFGEIVTLANEAFREGGVLYTVYLAFCGLLYFLAPIVSATVVLSFFKNAKAYFRYHFSLPADIYLISELNSRSLALAEDIIQTGRDRNERRLVVFTDVFEKKEEEANYELVQHAREMGCILFAKDITSIKLRFMFGDRIKRKIYFIGDNEDENIRQALTVITYCRQKEVYNTANTEFYVFARSVESEVLLDSIDNGEMKVRRINENRNLALRTLMEHPIFFDAIEENGVKKLNIVLVGVGLIGTELVKGLSWVGQMYGYELNLHIFDSCKGIKKKLAGICPELIEKNNAETERIDGMPFYKLHFYDETDVNTDEFLQKLNELGDVTTAYVTLGDDEKNIETAMRMRMQFEREHLRDGRHVPSIYAVVYSEIKNEIISKHGGLRTIKAQDYGITLIGSLRSSYCVDAIEQRNVERAGLACHLKWASSDSDKVDQIGSYSKYEYYRRSSMAEAIHAHLRGKLGLVPGMVDKEVEEQIYKYEHNRWCAFIRAEGYILEPGKKSDLAKVHKSLIPYGELTDEVRILDQIVVTEIMEGIDEE